MNRVCEACQTIPPIVAEGYQEQGVRQDINGIHCYVAAPQPTPSSGIIFISDIFGYFPQTMQGADILALADPGHLVVMPDFFNGEPMSINDFPPDTPEKKERFDSFFQNKAGLEPAAEITNKVIAGLKEKFPEVKKWGIFGLCWGGKAATFIARDPKNGFSSVVQAHPAMIDAADYKDYPVPHFSLFSKHEDVEIAKQIGETVEQLNNGSSHKTYGDDIHGWMGARSNLKNPAEAKSFEQGYTDVVEFFRKTLG